jgi:predicted helicase
MRSLVTQTRELKKELLPRIADRDLSQARDSLGTDLAREVVDDEAADVFAQAAVCAAAILAEHFDAQAIDWLRGSLRVWEQWVIDRATTMRTEPVYSVLNTQYSVPSTQAGTSSGTSLGTHLYDEFLHRYAPTSRRRHGVFFTPQPIADYIVRQIDELLTSEFHCAAGLAAASHLHVVDPACGTGVFLLAVIDRLHRRLGEAWNEFVPELLPRLTGLELLPVPAFLAKLNMAAKLSTTGYDFRHPGQINIRLGDALSPATHSALRTPRTAIPILLGNPPFSSLSANTNPWIARLVRGDEEVRGYTRAGDQRLGERKTWLHDDYVKFMRLTQWHVEEAGRGIVGFVTNRGYLDNTTFRLMRHELLRVFPHIRLVDLHGNRKGGDVSPDGRADENVFGLDQGVAIGLFSRPPTQIRCASEGASLVQYSELWGTRDAKLQALASGESASPAIVQLITPHHPDYLFVPTATVEHHGYAAAWSLADAMPVNTTAPVTARDHFVVGFTPAELHARIAEFRDLTIPDDIIRERYFRRTRSSRYQRGDTRSWKLTDARRAVAADADWQGRIVRCLYRPFDWRFVFWHPAMIDWPRNEVTRHLIAVPGVRSQEPGPRSGNLPAPSPESPAPLCLLARRQQLPNQPCTFFWISDGLALDGVIRSDNRGSESLFPLWLADDHGALRANFAASFLDELARRIGRQPEAEEVLGYIYAIFHSQIYRERFAAQLRVDFPRIPFPPGDDPFTALAIHGQRLIGLHLLRDPPSDSQSALHSDASEDYRVGGYAALQKWLQPKHRSPADPHFRQMVAAIAATRCVVSSIDEVVRQYCILDA